MNKSMNNLKDKVIWKQKSREFGFIREIEIQKNYTSTILRRRKNLIPLLNIDDGLTI